MNELLTIIFNLFIFPFEKVLLHKRRKELITNVKGKVLEIGSGGGVNFNYYNSKNIELLNVLDLKFNKFIMNHKLNKEYQGEFDLAPFIVITDPKRANKLTRRNGILA